MHINLGSTLITLLQSGDYLFTHLFEREQDIIRGIITIDSAPVLALYP